MPKKPDPTYFALFCTEDELERHLTVCADSDFHVVRDRALGLVRVHDRDTILLDAMEAAGTWVVRLHTAYYRHPFEPSDGNAPVGVP
jgi:hypothetical protein